VEKYGRAGQDTDRNITWRVSRKFKITDINMCGEWTRIFRYT